jgi:CheY-like chemotaxis protein
MRTTLVERRLEDSPLRRLASEAGDLLAEAIGTSRTLTSELSPLVLRDRGLIAALEWLARWMGERHGLRVDVDLDRGAEPAEEAVRLALFEAARELLLTVSRHTGARRAWVEAERDGDGRLRLVVSDDGQGFEAEPSVPDPDGGGSGLFGLRERISWLGGTVSVDGAPGGGTSVAVTVPARLDERVIAAVTAPPIRVTPSVAQEIRVLLVDDHEMVRQGLATMLEFEPDIVIVGEAANGREALRLARSLRPDVILMDITMPVMDGLEATRRISAEVPGVRVIGVSLHESSDMARAMAEAGAVGYLSKAGPTDRLVHEIRAVVRGLPASADARSGSH